MMPRPLLASLGLLLLAPGCEELSQITPRVRFDDLEVEEIDFQQVDADFVFRVENPNPIGVRLARFEYGLALEEVPLVSGEEPEGLALPALDSARVRVPARLVWQEVWETIQATRGEDQVDFALDGSFGFDTDWGPIDLPYDASGRFPALRTPRFQLGRLRVARVDVLRGEATVALDLNVDNDHGSSLIFSNLDYGIQLGGRDVADGLLPSLGTVPGATEGTVTVPLTVNLVQAGASIIDILDGGGRVDLGLDATVDVDTPFGPVPLAVDERGQVEVVRE
jgi:LEA14-like dessication related protein